MQNNKNNNFDFDYNIEKNYFILIYSSKTATLIIFINFIIIIQYYIIININ